jgi:hypothetical protein
VCADESERGFPRGCNKKRAAWRTSEPPDGGFANSFRARGDGDEATRERGWPDCGGREHQKGVGEDELIQRESWVVGGDAQGWR